MADFACPAGKSQAFLWDTDAPTLALRATPTGRKTYVFEARLHGATIRVNIGTVTDWAIEQARSKAQNLKRLIDAGTDPRELERQREAERAAKAAAERAGEEARQKEAAAAALTVGEVWAAYLDVRRPFWGELHYKDHIKLARAGGVPAKRGTDGRGVTIAMPLLLSATSAIRSLPPRCK